MKHAIAATVSNATDAAAVVADDASEAVHETLWNNPETWIVVAFVLFIGLALRYILPIITKGLDARAEKIRDQLEQASRLREQAEALLASYQEQQQKLLAEAESIIAAATSDAAALRANATADLKLALDRRMQQAQEKIARAEAEAVGSIRRRIIDVATTQAREILLEQGQNQSEAQAVGQALSAIEQQVH